MNKNLRCNIKKTKPPGFFLPKRITLRLEKIKPKFLEFIALVNVFYIKGIKNLIIMEINSYI